MLPAERVIGVDSGNFMGYPSMFLSVPDEYGFCFTQAFQSIGLGLATAIGAALAQPDRLPIAALGDGGALMGVAELDTVRRLGLPMIVIVYNDDAYGAEVHHFGPDGVDLSTVRFPPTDIAAIGRGFGFDAVTVRASMISPRCRRGSTGAELRCSSTPRSPLTAIVVAGGSLPRSLTGPVSDHVQPSSRSRNALHQVPRAWRWGPQQSGR